MEGTLGITGPALKWFRSYLGDRTLRVQIDYSFYASQEIRWSVPQGSVLGPLLFLIYLLPLGILIRKHGRELHAYADDTQLYISIKPINQRVVNIGVEKLENCITDIYTWMSQNKLKLNADNTEVLLELLVKQANTRTLRSNTKNLLQIHTNLKRFCDRAFCGYAPRLWNELPNNIKAADSVQNFKKQLKTLPFRKECI